MKHISDPYKILLIAIFAITYPLSMAVVNNFMSVNYILNFLGHKNALLAMLLYYPPVFGPGIAAVCFLPIKNKVIKSIIVFLYVLIIVPVGLFLSFTTMCQYNPNCVMP